MNSTCNDTYPEILRQRGEEQNENVTIALTKELFLHYVKREILKKHTEVIVPLSPAVHHQGGVR